MGVKRGSLTVLDYWWALELFNPQKVPKTTGRSRRPEARQVVEWRLGDALPWETLPKLRPAGKRPRVWRHTLYLGVYDLEATYQRLHEAFAEDHDAYDQRRAGLSACAGVLVDEDGVLLPASAVLSSSLWAVARVTAGTSHLGTQWANGFASDGAWLVERFGALDGARREAVGSEAPPAQDGDSLRQLLSAAHAAAGVTGDVALADRRVVIESVAVSASGEESTTDMGFLNSFFLDDLAIVREDVAANGPVGAIADYLTDDAKVRSDARVDVMVNRSVVNEGVSIDRLPMGRWPSDPDHGLALRQQFAVNRAMSGAETLMGVNGPPGTGKTTMLRDVLAGNIVERARRLAALPRSADAFTATTHRWTADDGHKRRVRQLREDLVGFEMVVASANNAAVENVTTEIPARTAIAEIWQAEADYFADIATATLKATVREEPESIGAGGTLAAWGLVAAKLGNKSNRGAFRSEFWFDKTDARTKQRVPGSAPRMQTRLTQWRAGAVARRSWPDARQAFRKAEQRVEGLIEDRRAAEGRLAGLDTAVRRQAAASRSAEKLATALVTHAEAVRAQADEVERAESAFAELAEERGRHIGIRPGVLETLFSFGRAARDWRAALEPLDMAVKEAQQRRRAVQQRFEQLQSDAARLAAESAANEEVIVRLSAELAELRKLVAGDRDRYGSAYPDEGRSGRQRELHAPWLDAEIDAARSELFLAALRLHEDFLADAASDMLDGLRAAVEVVAGVHPPRLEPEKVLAAWQLFFLVVPMVSTTFASFGRMFSGLGRQSLGWVLIDEAGQACPQHAVGAIWRARRVVTVGDPLQLQPVVTIPAKTQRDIAVAYGLSETWIPPRASVQTLADRVSRYGTWLQHDAVDVWVSAPLTVHRRCDEPMFGLCNDIAYNGIMVSAVPRRTDAFEGQDGPRIPASRWLHEPAMTRGRHLQPNEIARLRQEIERLMMAGLAPCDMIAISPFREIADQLARLDQDYPELKAGTIHTAQGREADVVFLVLGGDPAAPGAKAWAASTVNLVNVAASRAKRRLYVIGDQRAWERHNYFRQLSAALDQHSGNREGS